MQINRSFINILYGVSWFGNCGKQIPLHFGIKADSVSEVKEQITSVRWQNIVLEHQGDLTGELCNRSCQGIGKEDQAWNKLVDEFKRNYLPLLEPQWKSQLMPLGLNCKEIINSISFTILAIVMADAYKDIIPMADFYAQLLEIYTGGYLPCGWSGNKDKGCFIVY